MYEELIQSLREKAEFLTVSEVQKAPPGLSIKNLFAETMSEAADAIEAICDLVVTYEDRQRWIPVTERLPENFVEVLVTDGENVGIAALQGFMDDEIVWCNAYGMDYIDDPDDEDYLPITHWMPLPELPKVKDGDK